MALCLDELGQLNGDQVHHVVYMTASGQGKARMSRSVQLRPSYQWRTIMLSTGEIPISQKLAEVRYRKVRAGQLVRIVDVPAERGPYGVFDGYPDFDAATFSKRLRQAAIESYGAAGPAFVKALVDRGISGEHVRELVKGWTDKRVVGAHGQADRVAERLGLIAVAGELAVEFGIAPWPAEAASNAAAWALFEWLKAVGARPLDEQQAIAQVRGMIERYGESRFDNMQVDPGDREDLEPAVSTVITKDGTTRSYQDRPVSDRLGYRRADGPDRRWLVFPQAWVDVICAGIDPKRTAALLADRGMLERGTEKDGRLQRQVKIQGKKQRFYILTPAILDGED
jgi:uncharacterized protein (DUF927 family)